MEAYSRESEFAEIPERITAVRIPFLRCFENDVLDTTWKILASEMSLEPSEIQPKMVSSIVSLFSHVIIKFRHVISIASFQKRFSCIASIYIYTCV